MKFAVAFLFVGLLACSEALFGIPQRKLQSQSQTPFPFLLNSKSNAVFPDQFFRQRQDHFDPTNTLSFNQRYLENNQFFQSGGPILINVGADWIIGSPEIDEGTLIFDIARELRGTIFYLEHRYFGASRPTPDLTVRNMRFLRADQAIADLAAFIRELKSRPALANSPVLLVGLSRGGNLATWTREKYPELVTGVWASSAPVHAKVNWPEAKEQAARSIELVGGKNCIDRIEKAYRIAEDLVANGQVSRFNSELNLCTPLDPEDLINYWGAFSEITDDLVNLVNEHRGTEIQAACAVIEDESYPDAFAAYSAWTRSLFEAGQCYPYDYYIFTTLLRLDKWSDFVSFWIRQWIHGMCSQYGWFPTLDSDNHPFGPNLSIEMYYSLCVDIYGQDFTRDKVHANINRTNAIYGGFRPAASNVYFTYGELETWQTNGVQGNISSTATVNIIPRVSFVADAGSISSSDSAELRASKQRVISLFRQWIGA